MIAIDPGTTALGLAIFVDGELRRAHLLRAKNMAEMITKIPDYKAHTLVVERPQVYGFGGKADPNRLAQLTLIVGVCAGRIAHKELRLPYPAEWKGSVSKELMMARMYGVLSEKEKGALDAMKKLHPKSLWHNVYDAVEIGLWHLKRL